VPLTGGNTSLVVRVGDTVRRTTGHWTPAVHGLLRHLRAAGFVDAPEVLGADGSGREVLRFVDGEVGLFDPGPLPAWFATAEACMTVGRWLRRFHDAQRGFAPDAALPWRMVPGRALVPGEVVLHHDVAPYNVVHRQDGGVSVIDFDFCAPGDPVEDLAFSCWSWAPLWADRDAAERGFGDATMATTLHRLAALVDGYDATVAERGRLLPVIQARMLGHAQGLEALAAAGEPAFVRLLEAGVAATARRDERWVREHADLLAAAVGVN
jgi:Ser/Thr protein kinase RdoA (MazF antagonist)